MDGFDSVNCPTFRRPVKLASEVLDQFHCPVQTTSMLFGQTHTRFVKPLGILSEVAIEIVPMFVPLNIHRSKPLKVERQPFFSWLQRSVLWSLALLQTTRVNKRCCEALLCSRPLG